MNPLLRLRRLAPASHRRRIDAAILLLVVAAAAPAGVYALLLPLLRSISTAPAEFPWWPAFALTTAWAVCSALQHAALRRARSSGYALTEPLHEAVGQALRTAAPANVTSGATGPISRLAGADVMSTVTLPAHLAEPWTRAFITPAALITVMAAIDPPSGIVLLLLFPLLVLAHRVCGDLVVRTDAQVQASAAEASSRVIEFVQLQHLIRSAGAGSRAESSLDRALRVMHDRHRGLLRLAMPGLAGYGAAVQLALAVTVVTLAWRLGGATGPEAVVLAVLAARLVELATAAGELSGAWRLSDAALSRVEAHLSQPSLTEPDTPAQAPAASDVRVADVVAAHRAREVLSGLDFAAPEGTITAVTGPSGSGKSTLLALCARHLDPIGGAVLIGGVDTRALGSDSTSTMVSAVFQDSYLFRGTLRGAVLAGRPDAHPEDIDRVMRACLVDRIADRLPDGFESDVGPGGHALSGGERQRVALARALLKDAPILLLDEPTAALDAITEAEVVEAMLPVLRGRTVLIASHHPWILDRADRVVRLSGDLSDDLPADKHPRTQTNDDRNSPGGNENDRHWNR